MNVLLDTHTFLWFVAGEEKLSPKARTAIENPDNVKLVSMASFWEIAIKVSLGRLSLTQPFRHFLTSQMEINGFNQLQIEITHLDVVRGLPLHHRDPFDRLLAAQCIADDLTLFSADAAFDPYPVKRIW